MAGTPVDNLTAVLLVGNRDFGRCPLATAAPRSLWPLVDSTVLECQLELLRRGGVARAVVCACEGAPLPQRVLSGGFAGLAVTVLFEEAPRGTAGAARDALARFPGSAALVLDGGAFWRGSVREAIAAHREGRGAITLFTLPGAASGEACPAGVSMVEPRALETVGPRGYHDLKEQVMPALLRSGRSVAATGAPGRVYPLRDLPSYLALVAEALAAPGDFGLDLGRLGGDGVKAAGDAAVARGARVIGPAAVLDGASIEEGAVVVGPAVIGRGCVVERGAVVEASVLWDGARVAAGACVSRSVLGRGARAGRRAEVLEAALAGPGALCGGERADGAERPSAVHASGGGATDASASPADRAVPPSEHETAVAPEPGSFRAPRPAALFWLLAIGGAVAWSWSGVWADLWTIWRTNENYSSGLLVPLIAAYVAYARRRELAAIPARPSLWGVALLALAVLMRLAGTFLLYGSAERLSLIVAIVGVVVALFGLGVARRLAWVLAFLLLMLPWPSRLYNATSMPIQNLATRSSVFLLELLGWIVVREGNVLHIGDSSIAVAEACSGLRMLTAFMVVSALVAFLARRPAWQKALAFASSVPIAIGCNTLRLAVTAMAFSAGYGERVNMMFHDFGGFAMMPLALAAVTAEFWLFNRVYVDEAARDDFSAPPPSGTTGKK